MTMPLMAAWGSEHIAWELALLTAAACSLSGMVGATAALAAAVWAMIVREGWTALVAIISLAAALAACAAISTFPVPVP